MNDLADLRTSFTALNVLAGERRPIKIFLCPSLQATLLLPLPQTVIIHVLSTRCPQICISCLGHCPPHLFHWFPVKIFNQPILPHTLPLHPGSFVLFVLHILFLDFLPACLSFCLSVFLMVPLLSCSHRS